MNRKTDMQATFEHWVTTVWRPGDGAKLLRREYPRMALAAWEAAVVYIESKIQSSYEEAESEHLGDPDAKTGIYASRPDAQADERGAFEAWVVTDDGYRGSTLDRCLKRGYAYSFVEGAWRGWQARAAAPQAEATRQDRPHGVDDGACKQCYGEAVRGEQGALRGSCPDGRVCEIGCFGECEKRDASAPTPSVPTAPAQGPCLVQETCAWPACRRECVIQHPAAPAQGEHDCGCATNQACAMKTDGSCWRAD